MYNFSINDFEGPLDLLLHLVKASKMDISNIDVHTIIEEYLKFIHDMEELNIDVASEYLVMAAELIHLKSRILLNEDINENDSDEEFTITSEEDLKNKIIAYNQIKEITSSFQSLADKRSEIYTKLPENLQEYSDNILPSGAVTLEDLVAALASFQERLKYEQPLNTKIAKKEISVAERTQSIRQILNQKKKVNFIELFDIITKEYVIVTFLSILEMSKNDEIILEQDNNFSPIFIEKRV